ncbi:hypothetical protein EV714DRAFT_281020 [Schizophyllum commune]
MSRASSEDSRLSASDGERAREDRRAAEVGWGAPVYPAAGPRGVKRPRSRSPPPVAVDAPEASQHRPLPARSRRTSASAQATSPLHASGRRRSWMHRRGTSYAAIQETESTENTLAQGPVTIVLEPAPVDFDAKEVRTGASKTARGKQRELEHGLTLSVRRLRALVHPQSHSIPAPIRNTASILLLAPMPLQAAELSAPHPRRQETPHPRRQETPQVRRQETAQTQMQPAARAAYAQQPAARDAYAQQPAARDAYAQQPAARAAYAHQLQPEPAQRGHPSRYDNCGQPHPARRGHPSRPTTREGLAGPSSREGPSAQPITREGPSARPMAREGPSARPITREGSSARPMAREGPLLGPPTHVSRPPSHSAARHRLPAREQGLRLAPETPPPVPPPVSGRLAGDEQVLRLAGDESPLARFVVDESVLAAGGRVGAGVHVTSSRQPAAAGGQPVSASGKPMSASGKPVSKGRKPASASGRKPASASGNHASRGDQSGRPAASYGLSPSHAGPSGQYAAPGRPPSSDMPLAPSRLALPSQAKATTSPGAQPASIPLNASHPPYDARQSTWPSYPGYTEWPDTEQVPRSHPPTYPYYPLPPPPHALHPAPYPYDSYGYDAHGPPHHDDHPRPPQPVHPAAFRGVHRAEDFQCYAQPPPQSTERGFADDHSSSSAPHVNELPRLEDHIASLRDAAPLDGDEAGAPTQSAMPQSSIMDRKATNLLAELKREREAWEHAGPARSPPPAAHEQHWTSHHARRESEDAAREHEDPRQAEDMGQQQWHGYHYYHGQQPLDEGGRQPETSAAPSTSGGPSTSDAPTRTKRAPRQARRDHQRVLEDEEKRRRRAEAKAERQRALAEAQRRMEEHMTQPSKEERQRQLAMQREAERLRETQKRDRRWWNGVSMVTPAISPPDLQSAFAGAKVLTHRLWTCGPSVPAPPESAPWLQAASEVQFMVTAEEGREPLTGTIKAQGEAETKEREPAAEAEAPTAAPSPTRAASPNEARPEERHPLAESQPAEPHPEESKAPIPYWFHPNVGWTFEPPAVSFLDPPCENETLFRPSHTPVPALEPASWDAHTALDALSHESEIARDAATSTAEHHDPVAPSYPTAGHSFPLTDCASTSRLPGALNPGTHGEAPQDDLVQTLAPVSQRAYVVPREYSVEHDFAARLVPCPVCEGREESDDEGSSLPPSCVHEKVLAECERCKELGLAEGARWKTQCIAQEGVPRHQIWTRSTMSEGVRAAALAAYADEYIDEEDENELRYPDEEPTRQDVGVDASVANPVEDPQTVQPLKDSDSDDEIQVTGYNPAPHQAADSASWGFPSAIANRYLPIDCVLTLRDGVLIPVPRASVAKDAQIVESLPIVHARQEVRERADASTQAEALDEARNLKRTRDGNGDESPRPSKVARSAPPPSGPTEDDDAAAAQALVLLLNGNGPMRNQSQPGVDASVGSTPSSSMPEAPSSSSLEAPSSATLAAPHATISEVSSAPSADSPTCVASVDASAPSLANVPKATEDAAPASPWPVWPPPEVFMEVDDPRAAPRPASTAESKESATSSDSLQRSGEGQRDGEGRGDTASEIGKSAAGEVDRSSVQEIGEPSPEANDDPPSVFSAEAPAVDGLHAVDQAADAQRVIDAEVVVAVNADESGSSADGDLESRAATPSTVVEDGEIVEKDLSSAVAVDEMPVAIADEVLVATGSEVPAANVVDEESPADLAPPAVANEATEPAPSRLLTLFPPSPEASSTTAEPAPCRPMSSAADVAVALFPPSPGADVASEPTRLSSEAAYAGSAESPAHTEEAASSAPAASMRVTPPPSLYVSPPPSLHVDSTPSLHVRPPPPSITLESPVSPEMPIHKLSQGAGSSMAVDAAQIVHASAQDLPSPSLDVPPPQPSGFAGTLENGYARAFAAGCPPNDRQLPPRARLSFKEHLALKRKREAEAAERERDAAAVSERGEKAEREGKRARIDAEPPSIPAALMTRGGSRPRSTPASQKAAAGPASDRKSPSRREGLKEEKAGTSSAYRDVMGFFCM